MTLDRRWNIGLQGTGDFAYFNAVTGQFEEGDYVTLPRDMSEFMFARDPNGTAALFGMLTMTTDKELKSTVYDWMDEEFWKGDATITAIATDPAVTQAYVAGGTAGTILHVKTTNNLGTNFVAGCVIAFTIQETAEGAGDGDPLLNIPAIIRSVSPGNDTTVITVELLTDDYTSVLGNTLADADFFFEMGLSHPEASPMTTPRRPPKHKYENYSQIFIESTQMSRTATQVNTFPGMEFSHQEYLSGQRLRRDVEMSLFFGVPREWFGLNNEPQRSYAGVFWAARKYGLVDDYRVTDIVDPGTTWVDGGWEWFCEMVRRAFLYGPTTRIAFCGSAVLCAINKLILAHNSTEYQIVTGQIEYGIEVSKLITPHGTMILKTHPLFNISAALNSTLFCAPFEYLRRRTMLPISLIKGADDPLAEKYPVTHQFLDAKSSVWIAELGFEYHWPDSYVVMAGFGLDNINP